MVSQNTSFSSTYTGLYLSPESVLAALTRGFKHQNPRQEDLTFGDVACAAVDLAIEQLVVQR